MKIDVNPIDQANSAPRCKAKAKRTGQQCKAPAVRGWTVCRVHGAGGGAKSGRAHPRYSHGGRTTEATSLRAKLSNLMRAARSATRQLNKQ